MTQNLLKRKWCSFCQKESHTDSECWSTRPANWPQGYQNTGMRSVFELIADRCAPMPFAGINITAHGGGSGG